MDTVVAADNALAGTAGIAAAAGEETVAGTVHTVARVRSTATAGLAAGVAVSSTETALRSGCGEAASDVALVEVAANGEALSAGFWLADVVNVVIVGGGDDSANASGSDGGGCDGDSMNGVSLASGVCASSRPEFCLRYCGEYELKEPNSGESSQPSWALSSSAAPPRSWL